MAENTSDNAPVPPAGDSKNPSAAVNGDDALPPVGRIVDLAIDQELAESYLTYAMSTIVDRALPDARDGLKPSQRRILVAMNDLNLRPGRKHIKCAKICGDTSGNYHPHGEAVIYPTLVGMAQPWKMRHPLIDPQGNFGSIDPDPPAAMRYTEARMAGPAADMLDDLDLDTVDFKENYDGRLQEPTVLPSKFPNLLVNGGMGIAVGMAASLPPHNLGEICDAIVAVIDNPEIHLADLIKIVPGPDFPTGGTIHGRRGIIEAYDTGRGRVTIRAKIHHEESRNGRNLIVVTQLPYQVSKNDAVIQKIKECVREDRITDIANVVDESSNRSGMRLVIELKKGADPIVVENQLYELTPLQSNFSIINIALVRGQPRTLGLKALIQLYIDHRIEIIRRRTAYRLRQAQQEAHRIEGLIYAVCDIDAVIKLIRESRTRDEAIEKLMARGFRIPPNHAYAPQIPERFKALSASQDARLSRVQAEGIGRLQLIQLVGLAIETLVADYTKLLAQIEEYESILADPAKVLAIIRQEVTDLRAKYADPRRTQFGEEIEEFDMAALTPVERVVVTITHQGYVKRLPADQYRTQGRGGKGVIGADAKDGDFTEQVFVASTHDDLLCFTDTGRVFKIKVYDIPEGARTSRGRSIVNLLEIKEGEQVRKFMPIEDFEREESFLLFATANGTVKRTALKDYRNVNRSGIIAITLREGDSIVGVTHTSGQDHILLGTRHGVAIRFHEDDARAMGRSASGVRGIDLAENDAVVGLVCCNAQDSRDLLAVTTKGFGKRTPLLEYLVQQEDGTTRVQSRGGKGRKGIDLTDKNGELVALLAVEPSDDLMLISTGGMIVRINANTVRQTGRAAQGVKVINLDAGDSLTGVARITDDGSDSEGEAAAADPSPTS
ncbi:MAG: DNA gyrase subunit A [Phycisphaeraceae bacterium]|nr:DNA gyrase subunit A [Phycisphaeraceae bacterium]